VAHAVLKAYIKGGTLEAAALAAGREIGVGKTRALEFFRNNAGPAFNRLKVERIQSGRKPVWNPREERQLEKYYGRLNDDLRLFLEAERQPDNSSNSPGGKK
jgi:hypothetical protein